MNQQFYIHEQQEDIYQRLEGVATLRSNPNRTARGIDLSAIRKSNRKSNNLSFFDRVKENEEESRKQELRRKLTRARIRARFLALLPQIREELVKEGRLPTSPFVRSRSLRLSGEQNGPFRRLVSLCLINFEFSR